MGPGPSDVCDRVLEAMARPTIGHLDPIFIKMMDETKQLLQYAFQTQNELTFAVSAPGMAGMECCFANLVEPDDKVIIAKNGFFGERMKENVERFGGIPIVIDDEWGTKVDLNKIESALNEHKDAKIVASVHAETSTGALTDPESITKLAHDHGCLSIVDTVTGLVGVPLKVDEWGIDAIYSGTQKCLSASPGLSPISFSNAAKEKIKNRKKRHKENHMQLREGLEKLNIEFLVKEEDRLPQLNAIYIPDGVNDLESRQKLLNEFNLEIGAGLGVLAGKVWRIGLMGQSSNKKNIEYCLNSLAEVI